RYPLYHLRRFKALTENFETMEPGVRLATVSPHISTEYEQRGHTTKRSSLGQACIFRIVAQNPRCVWAGLAAFSVFMVVSSRKLALLAVPKSRRSAIRLTERVVSVRRR